MEAGRTAESNIKIESIVRLLANESAGLADVYLVKHWGHSEARDWLGGESAM